MFRGWRLPLWILLGCVCLLTAASPEQELKAAAVLHALAHEAWLRGELDRAEELEKPVLRVRERLAPDGLEMAGSLTLLGSIARRRGDFEAAEALGRRALDLCRKVAPDTLEEVPSLILLGRVAQARADIEEAGRHYRQLMALGKRLAPGGVPEALGFYHLASLAWIQGDLERAETGLRRALAILEKAAPGGFEYAQSLSTLSIVLSHLGDLATAERFARSALAFYERVAPEGLDVAIVLNGLANIAAARGDLDMAEASYRRCLAIQERIAPGGLEAAAFMNNVGIVLYLRGDYEAAIAHYRGALAAYEKLNPDSLDVAEELNNLSQVAEDVGDFAQSEAYARRAVEIAERIAPNTLELAENLNTAGHAVLARNDLALALKYFQRDLEITRSVAPGSLSEATSLSDLGHVFRLRGDLAAAEDHLKRALAIQEVRASRHSDLAWTLHELGTIWLKAGRDEQAVGAFGRAVAIIETHIGRLGGSAEAKADFRARYHHFYWDYLDLLLRKGRPEEAFLALERSRAQGLLAILAERDLVFAADLPEELHRARWRTAAAYDRASEELAATPLEESDQAESLNAELRRLRAEAAAVEERIRREAPKLAALQYPQPLDLHAARRVLDPGTVMLSYSVGPDRTHLFVLSSSGPLETFEIQVGEKEWRREVERFRRMIQESRPNTAANTGPNTAASGIALARRQTLEALGRRLYERLLSQAEPAIARGRRLLILPDGALHSLPWASLVRGESGQFLIEWRPFHIAASATVFAELKGLRRTDPPERQPVLVAFADPLRGSGNGASPRSASGALPASRTEVQRIAALFSPNTKTYLGSQATEERARAIGRGARYVHFATHGVLDERSPLSSGLALAEPAGLAGGTEDGLLQAWEVFEGLHLGADLVVLSACESGLGKELPGEGLLGLTRAFQYAGARAVAASLWKVSDRATQELMVRFYRHLKNRLPADQALRAAQVEMIRNGKAPFDWAAFEIFGDVISTP